MADVYRFVLPDGQEFAWHGSPEALHEVHPGAQITGRLVTDAVGQGIWEAYESAEPEPVNYQRMTVAQLRAEYAKRGVEVPEGAKKAELITSLVLDDNGEKVVVTERDDAGIPTAFTVIRDDEERSA